MGTYKEINGEIVNLSLEMNFDVIGHGLNCQNVQRSGVAKRMSFFFRTDTFPMEKPAFYGDYNKLGCIDYKGFIIKDKSVRFTEKTEIPDLIVVNCYQQYYYATHPDNNGIPLDYDALRLCLRKINRIFKGKRIGLPKIGCNLAGGDWTIVKPMIQEELKDCDVTIIIYDN